MAGDQQRVRRGDESCGGRLEESASTSGGEVGHVEPSIQRINCMQSYGTEGFIIITCVLFFRRDRVKREAQDLIQGLQKEVDKLKKTIDELDKNPNLQVKVGNNPHKFNVFFSLICIYDSLK